MKKATTDKKANSKLYCIPMPPLLWSVNRALFIATFIILLIFAIYFIVSFILKKKKKQNLLDEKTKKKLLFVSPLFVYLIACIFLGESPVFYLFCFFLLALSFLVSIFIGIKKKIIKKKLIFKFLIIFFAAISILSIVAFTVRLGEEDVLPESIPNDYEREYRDQGIWISDVLGCPRRLF